MLFRSETGRAATHSETPCSDGLVRGFSEQNDDEACFSTTALVNTMVWHGMKSVVIGRRK